MDAPHLDWRERVPSAFPKRQKRAVLSFPHTRIIPSLAALPADVLIEILASAPDFAALAAAASTCRALRATYEYNAQALRRAVANTLCGAYWPLALRAVHARRAQDAAREVYFRAMEPLPVSPVWIDIALPPLWTKPSFALVSADAHALDALGAAAALVELTFSQRNRDMSCAYSLLSPNESRRFLRTLYTHELFVAMYALREDAALMCDDERLRQRAIVRFLASHTTQELEELQEVDLFIEEATTHAAKASSARHALPVLNASALALSRVARLLETPESRIVGSWPLKGLRIGAQLPGHGLVSLARYKPLPMSLSVLDMTGAQCQACNIARVYTVSDSMWLRSAVPVRCVQKILPEPLACNRHIGHTLAYILTHETSASLMLESMYAQRGLDRAHAMCLPCLQQFIETYIFAWCREQLVARGVEIPDEDCAEGGHCDAQTDLEAHAREMNHLCDAKDVEENQRVL